MSKLQVMIKPILYDENVGDITHGAVVSNVDWGDNKLPPMGKRLMKLKNERHTAIDITNSILKQGSDGVIFGGLNWLYDIDGLYTILKEVAKTDLKILIAIPDSIDAFELALGRYFIKSNMSDVPSDLLLDSLDDSFYQLIGRNGLDAFIGRDYCIVTGMFDSVKMYNIIVIPTAEGVDENE